MLKTFAKGGIHPPENKITAGFKIKKIPVPEQVIIPLNQHIGKPAIPKVKKGDSIKTGQLIAEADGFISANIHSPVTGKIFKIDKFIDISGYKRNAIIINAEKEDIFDGFDEKTLNPISDLSKNEIIQKIKNAGIVGLGGAAFPTHVKLMPPENSKIETLLVNGVECEPYLTSDHALMLEKSDEIITGIKLLMKASGAKKAFIGIENNKKDAISKLTEKTKNTENIFVVPLKVKYPQGGEKQLIKAVVGKEVPSGELPVKTGVTVQNVGTIYAVYEAVAKNKPLYERIITVTGKTLKNPGVFIVRNGTPVKKLIDATGGLPEDTGKIINGGPMTGKTLISPDIPVIKGTSGILILPRKESKRKKTQVCIKCAKCVNVCPAGIEPYLLMLYAEKRMFEKCKENNVSDCIECGSCSYICPANRPLLDYIRLGKNAVKR